MIRHILTWAAITVFYLPLALQAAEPQVAHMVYFKLKDRSGAAQEKLVAACGKHLSKHEGTLYFSAGVLAQDLDREVNDRDFDVSLNLVFRSKAAHDKYQTHPRHLKFIEENKDSWSAVRVFDSYIASDSSDSDDTAAAKRIPLPDLASSFAGMIRGKVAETRDAQIVVSVDEVTKEWKQSRAKDAKSLVGKKVLVDAGQNDLARRFLSQLQAGETVTLDVAHKQGESLTILELTEEQRQRSRRR